MKPGNSSILYQNSSSTVFLVDIPASIARAQDLSPESHPNIPDEIKSTPSTSISRKPHKRRHILSSPPLKQPYAVQNEPKSETARAKVFAQIPQSEREIHEAIRPLVRDALSEIRQIYPRGLEWGLPRHFLVGKDGPDSGADPKQNEEARSKQLSKIRKGKSARERLKLLKRQYDNAFDGEEHKHELLDIQALPRRRGSGFTIYTDDHGQTQRQPPLILSPGRNRFEDGEELCNKLVKNTSSHAATIELRSPFAFKSHRRFSFEVEETQHQGQVFIIPPLSRFILCDLPISDELDCTNPTPIPDLDPEQKFNLIVLDPPWANRSVRRSGHYQTQSYLSNELLKGYIYSVLAMHSYSHPHPPPQIDEILDLDQVRPKSSSNLSIGAIWITNSAISRAIAHSALIKSGFSVCEEWVWIKTTVEGEPVTPIEGLWRKPYEVLIIGKRDPETASDSNADAGASGVLRRAIAAVPDVHSRKPNLKAVFERVFFTAGTGAGLPGQTVRYSALEVFARNLTAGWWACGNEVLKFNSESWWVDE
ncbi:MT-A70-domain-containing protein [Aspergillus falconensis]